MQYSCLPQTQTWRSCNAAASLSEGRANQGSLERRRACCSYCAHLANHVRVAHTRAHAHAHAHSHTRARARTRTHAHNHTHTRTQSRMHACMHARTHALTQKPHTHTNTNTHARAHTRTSHTRTRTTRTHGTDPSAPPSWRSGWGNGHAPAHVRHRGLSTTGPLELVVPCVHLSDCVLRVDKASSALAELDFAAIIGL